MLAVSVYFLNFRIYLIYQFLRLRDILFNVGYLALMASTIFNIFVQTILYNILCCLQVSAE